MSKIPQGEWNAIAARYQDGESISKIARSYNCTPPAIHYILKRNRQRPAEIPAHPMSPRPAEPAGPRLVRINPVDPAPAPAPWTTLSGEHLNNGAPGPSLVRAVAPKPQPGVPLPVRHSESALNDVPPANSPEPPGPAHRGQPAPLPGLDGELHLRAEAAIETFRSSFDEALTEGSPGVCERLRRAATDLMRVAARTTMVLDRVNAIAERSARAHNYPRSAHAGEDFEGRG